MKSRFITLLLLLMSIVVTFAQLEKKDYSLASVGQKTKGVYMFIGSEPHYEYDYIATIKVSSWWKGEPEENFERIVKKARKKHPYFTGMIFKKSNFNEVDLIRFKGLEASRGGVAVNSKVSFLIGKKYYCGSVVGLESKKNKATVQYLNEYGEKKNRKILYRKLTPLSDEQYEDKIDRRLLSINVHKFEIGQPVSWTKKRVNRFGKVVATSKSSHNVSIAYLNKYGEEKISKINVLAVRAIDEDKFIALNDTKVEKVSKHVFVKGETVTWLKNKALMFGEVFSLNSSLHKASIKYINKYGEEKVAKINYLKIDKMLSTEYEKKMAVKLEKISKHIFEIDDIVNFVKNGKEFMGVVVKLDDRFHKATVQYQINDEKEKVAKINYLELIKSE